MDPAKGVMVMRSVLWRLNQLADAPEPMWESIYCSRKVAYGCGRHGQKVVEGITLFRSLPDHQDVTSSMTIRLSAEAIGIVKADLGLGSRSALQAQGFVQAASEGLLVLAVNFSVHNPSNRGYYLVYDSTDASLYMTPCLPSPLKCSYTLAPVPRRIDGGGGSEPQLVLTAYSYRTRRRALLRRRGLPLPVHSGGVTCQHRPAVGYKGAVLPTSFWLLQGGRDVLVPRQGLLGRSLARPRVLRPAGCYKLRRAV